MLFPTRATPFAPLFVCLLLAPLLAEPAFGQADPPPADAADAATDPAIGDARGRRRRGRR